MMKSDVLPCKSKAALSENIVAICASGPSLTRADCLAVVAAGIPIIAVNSSWKAVPECSYIFSGDLQWWLANRSTLPKHAQKWSCNNRVNQLLDVHYFEPDYRDAYNSGLRAILFATSLNATKIILLGFDCSIKEGIHWHGNHERLGNPDDLCIKRWQRQFQRLSDYLDGKVEVINCSRKTALLCFPQKALDEVLEN